MPPSPHLPHPTRNTNITRNTNGDDCDRDGDDDRDGGDYSNCPSLPLELLPPSINLAQTPPPQIIAIPSLLSVSEYLVLSCSEEGRKVTTAFLDPRLSAFPDCCASGTLQVAGGLPEVVHAPVEIILNDKKLKGLNKRPE